MIVGIERDDEGIILHLREDDNDPIIDEKDWLELGFSFGRVSAESGILAIQWHEYGTDTHRCPDTFIISIEDLTLMLSGQLAFPWLHD